jgi:hypothetical protein
MCEATHQLKRIKHELRIQRGNGVIDLGMLVKMATTDPCEHQETT